MSIGLSTERDKWLAERRKGIGASDAPTVCGIRARPTRLELWLQKRGEIESEPPTEAMQWGLRLEPLIAQAYEERTGRAIISTQICSQHQEYPWMRATIDAYDAAGDTVEFKAVGSWMGRKLPDDGDSDGLPEPWIIQVQHQMAVDQNQRAHIAVFVDMGLRLYTVERNDDMLADIIAMESEFWGLVESGTPPAEFQPEDAEVLRRHFNRDSGPEIDLTRDGGAVLDLVDFQRSSEEIKGQTELRDRMKASLLMKMGNASLARIGTTTLKRKLVNAKERTQTIKASSYVRFTVSSGDEE